MDKPRKYHQIVPRTPHVANANQPYSSEKNITLNANAEIGKSATKPIANGIFAGPLRIGWLEIAISTDVRTNKSA
jgi:hypothetical protein